MVAGGRKARGARAVDLFIAATAVANGLALYTNDVEDYRPLRGMLEVVKPAVRD